MKKILYVSLWIMSCILAVSCSQDEQNVEPATSDQEIGEIARIEKETGITLFKRVITFENGNNKATLLIATKSEEIFKNIVENFDVVIKPVYSRDMPANIGKAKSNGAIENGVEPNNENTGEEILTEFEFIQTETNVIGFTTSYHLKTKEDASGGRVALTGYDYYITSTSDNWPTYFWVSFPSQGGGLNFNAKWKWYNGWVTYTVCIESSTYGLGVGDCYQEHNLPGVSSYTLNVDGPWRVKTIIGYYNAQDFTWGYIR